VVLLASIPLLAQPNTPNRVPLAFDRFYNFEEMTAALQALVAAYPELLTMESLGHSAEGRDMWLVTMNNPATGSDRDKPAIYIDANVHGNEVQGSEVCLYTLWYLTKSYGVVDKLTRLVDERAFYVVPCVNPDGRAHWFDHPNTSSSSRSGKAPTDNDYDGLYDEDGADDLDGDGYITTMWKQDPNGRYRRSVKDPRRFERVGRDETGEWTRLGLEGIDNDDDGRLNEDGPGGYDMNRNWPSDWKPEYIQFGAGEYPFSCPETAVVGRFILDHPNIAAAQSYHNAGGMILRGPGDQGRENYYPASDRAVYDEIGKTGERILPHYRYMVLWSDLYPVRGGFVNWVSEGLGIFSFTNELWTTNKYYYGKEGDWDRSEQRYRFGDLLQFEELFVQLKPFDHPTYGEILIGGWNKYASRVPPLFMLEELCHRNFAFTVYHADQMPKLAFERVEVERRAADEWTVTAEIRNHAVIPTISSVAAERGIGARDIAVCRPVEGHTARAVASGTMRTWRTPSVTLTRQHPDRLWLNNGIGSRGGRIIRWFVSGRGSVELEYRSQRGGSIKHQVILDTE
jgi:hypothetical protein